MPDLSGAQGAQTVSVFDETSLNALVIDSSGRIGVTQGTSPWVTTANIGTTNGLALDATLTGGSQKAIAVGSVTTAAPSYTNGTNNNLSLTTAGALRIDGSGTTQPVSGTVTANAGTGNFTVVQATGTNLHTVIDNATLAVTQSGTWNLNNISGTISLPTGASTLAEQQTQTTSLQLIDNLPNTQGSTTAGQSGVLTLGAVTTAAPTYTTAQSSPLSLTTSGALRIDNTSWLGSTAPTVGSKTSANSIPVVIASDQAALNILTSAATATAITVVTRSAANQTFLASNTARKGASVHNDANAVLYLKLGATASAASYTVRMASQDHYEIPFHYTGIIDGIWASAGGGDAKVTELT